MAAGAARRRHGGPRPRRPPAPGGAADEHSTRRGTRRARPAARVVRPPGRPAPIRPALRAQPDAVDACDAALVGRDDQASRPAGRGRTGRAAGRSGRPPGRPRQPHPAREGGRRQRPRRTRGQRRAPAAPTQRRRPAHPRRPSPKAPGRPRDVAPAGAFQRHASEARGGGQKPPPRSPPATPPRRRSSRRSGCRSPRSPGSRARTRFLARETPREPAPSWPTPADRRCRSGAGPRA
jgi:hypothetical protein